MAASLVLGACSQDESKSVDSANVEATEAASKQVETSVATLGPENPFYAVSTLYMEYPPFDKIKNEHYGPAMAAGRAEQIAEIEAIANNPESPFRKHRGMALLEGRYSGSPSSPDSDRPSPLEASSGRGA